jgi:hypothetical protein
MDKLTGLRRGSLYVFSDFGNLLRLKIFANPASASYCTHNVRLCRRGYWNSIRAEVGRSRQLGG